MRPGEFGVTVTIIERVRLMSRMVLGRLALTVMFLLVLAESVVAQQAPQRKLVVPSDEALVIMIKSALIAQNHANLTGNYTVLRDLAAPSFREANSPARLADIFRDLRERQIDLAPILLLQPKLEREPWINGRRLLRLQGFFDSRPERVNFNLAYTEVGGKWRLFAIGVDTERVRVAAGAAADGRRSAQAQPSGAESAQASAQDGDRPDPPARDAGADSAESSIFSLPSWLLFGD